MSNPRIVRLDTGDTCIKSYPCQHICKIYYADNTIKREMLFGNHIYKLCKENGLPLDEHFLQYR